MLDPLHSIRIKFFMKVMHIIKLFAEQEVKYFPTYVHFLKLFYTIELKVWMLYLVYSF